MLGTYRALRAIHTRVTGDGNALLQSWFMDSALLLDFGGTLDADGIPWADRFYAACDAESHGVARDAFGSAFRASDQQLEHLPGIGSFGFRHTVVAQAQLLGPLLGGPAWFDAETCSSKFIADSEAIAARNQPVLAELARHFRLAIVSNFTGNVEPCLGELGLLQYMTVVLDSAREGVRKPDAQIFRRALSRLGGPAQAWMVGDNFDADIRPASSLGLSTCWIAPSTRSLPALGIATTRIASFSDLPGQLACMV